MTQAPQRRPVAQLRDPRVTVALRLVDEGLSRGWTIGDLASAVELSPCQFTRLFKQQLHVRPIEYLRRQRLERAALLLSTTVLSVKQIRHHVGAQDPSHFARDFREYFGVSPRDYRKRHFAVIDFAHK